MVLGLSLRPVALVMLAAVLCSLVMVGTAAAATIAARVVGIADGDTLTMLDADKVQHVVRLDGIDAPEKAQPFGNVSKRHLSDLAFGRDAVAECHKVDRYGRSVCRVLVDGVDVCLEQVRAGLAWHFKRYEREQREEHRRAYAEAEEMVGGRSGAPVGVANPAITRDAQSRIAHHDNFDSLWKHQGTRLH